MKTVWTKGLNEDAKDELQREFVASTYIRKRLSQILQDKIELSHSELRAKASYENPAWAFKQADGMGYERALSEVISLLSSRSVDKD